MLERGKTDRCALGLRCQGLCVRARQEAAFEDLVDTEHAIPDARHVLTHQFAVLADFRRPDPAVAVMLDSRTPIRRPSLEQVDGIIAGGKGRLIMRTENALTVDKGPFRTEARRAPPPSSRNGQCGAVVTEKDGIIIGWAVIERDKVSGHAERRRAGRSIVFDGHFRLGRRLVARVDISAVGGREATRDTIVIAEVGQEEADASLLRRPFRRQQIRIRGGLSLHEAQVADLLPSSGNHSRVLFGPDDIEMVRRPRRRRTERKVDAPRSLVDIRDGNVSHGQSIQTDPRNQCAHDNPTDIH